MCGSASGQKIVAPEVQQEKTVVTHGKHREKPTPSPQYASERVVVENNSLSEAADYLATGKKPEDRYRDAQQQLKEAVDEFKAKNCAGLSSEACGEKMDAHRDELLAGAMEFGSDFVPVYSDIKSFAERHCCLLLIMAPVSNRIADLRWYQLFNINSSGTRLYRLPESAFSAPVATYPLAICLAHTCTLAGLFITQSK